MASMLKDDVDEGVTHIFGQNTKHEASQEKNKDEDETHLNEDASEKVTEDSASEPETTPADNLLYSSVSQAAILIYLLANHAVKIIVNYHDFADGKRRNV